MTRLFLIRLSSLHLIAILCFFSIAHSQDFKKEIFTVKNGLPDSYIHNIYQDAFGFLWVGTLRGLSRYDGREFVNYGVSEGLPNPIVDAIFMDSRRRLWVGTRNGIARLQGGKLITYVVNDSLKIDYIADIIETKEHLIWALTTRGVYQLDDYGHAKKISIYPGYENHYCPNIIQSPEGLYINYDTLLVLKKPDNSFKILENLTPSIFRNRLHRYGQEIFISRIDGLYKIKESFEEKLYDIKSGPGDNVVFFRDTKNRFWIWTEKDGLCVYIPGELKPKFIFKDNLGFVSTIHEDKSQNIWIADSHGLIKINTAEFNSFDNPIFPHTGPFNNLFAAPNGEMILNAPPLNGKKCFLLIYQNGHFTQRFFNHIKDSGIRHDFQLDHYAIDNKQNFWYVTRTGLLIKQDHGQLLNLSENPALTGNRFRDVIYDRFRHCILTCGKGLWMLKDSGVVPFHFKNDSSPEDEIMSLYQCSNNEIVFVTRNNTVYSIDDENRSVQQLDGRPYIRKGQNVTNCMVDELGNLWINFSPSGLNCYEWKNGKLFCKYRISEENGLPHGEIISFCFDLQHRLWIATESGLAVFQITKPVSLLRLYSPKELDIDTWGGALFSVDTSGNVWMTTSDKLFCFYPGYPGKIFSQTVKPDIIIDRVDLNSRLTDWHQYSDSLDGIFQLPYGAKLPYYKNSLQFSFKGVFVSGALDLHYEYMLDKLDSAWSTTKNNFVSYNNLPPGNYIFKVRTYKPSAGWSQTASFTFNIDSPFWQKWWFTVCLGIAGSFGIIMFFRYRINKIKSEALIKNQLLESEMKALRAQMNPHFIYNCMNSIKALIQNDDKPRSIEYLTTFSKLIRTIFQNSDKRQISLYDEIETCKLYTQLESMRLGDKLRYEFCTDQNLDLKSVMVPALIVQPFIENAIWHGIMPRHVGTVIISVTGDEDKIVCEVMTMGLDGNFQNSISRRPQFPMSPRECIYRNEG